MATSSPSMAAGRPATPATFRARRRMSDNVNRTAATNAAPGEAAVFRKVSLRLLPFLLVLYVINLIDRTNIGIARLQMVDEQKILDEGAYSLGAGIFYVGYLLFEVPANLILLRMGARVW